MGKDRGGLALPLVALFHLGDGVGVDLVAVVEGVSNRPKDQGAVACGVESV